MDGAFVVFMSIGLWVAGRRISKYFLKRNPASAALSKVTGTGFAISVCIVFLLSLGMAARQLAPDTVLGDFLDSKLGLGLFVIGCVVLFSIAGIVLRKSGRAMYKRGGKP
jgi:hypothetical protein